jgi:Outer membrane protein beta-barrel domain
VYAGTFISNFFHQFYDDAKWTPETRPNISKVSPQLGARYAYWPLPLIGVEGEGSIAIAGVDGYDDTAKLYGLRVQAIAQYPVGQIAPFAAIGAGILHTSSNTLGSDTDWPIHVGVGVRYFVMPALAVRFDARLIRGPSSQPPYTLGASYGEFALGVSWVPETRGNVAE